MKPIKLSDLIDSLEFESPDYITRVDLEQGRVVTVEESVLRAVEGDDQELLSDLAEGQKEEIEIARAIAEDAGNRFLAPPDKFDFHEYNQMERFIKNLDDANAAEHLWRAIKGKGAFRYFKDTVARLGLRDQWFRFRDDAMKEHVLDWAQANKVSVVDDSSRPGR